MSIASVAREAGVSTALIHNQYPEISEEIRELQGRSSRAQRDAKNQDLKQEKEKNRLLRAELKDLHGQVAKLASINETLGIECQNLRARIESANVHGLGVRRNN